MLAEIEYADATKVSAECTDPLDTMVLIEERYQFEC